MARRISQVLFAGLGGHGSVVFSLIEADKKKEWDNSLIFYGNQPVKQEYAEYCRKNEIPFAGIYKPPGVGLVAYRQAYQALKAQRPEIVMLNVPTLVLVGWWYCLFHRARLVMIEHNANQIKRKGEWICSLLGMILCNKIVYLTNEYADEVKKKLALFYRRRKVNVIPNGIDLSLFSPRQSAQPGNVIRISMVSRFSFSKDHETLIKAFALLKNELKGFQLELCLAGDGETLVAMKKLAADLNLPEVKFPGMLNEQQVAELTRTTDIYVLATLGETMSTAIMQAMACRLPILASNVRGVTNLIDNTNGWLFTSRDEKDLAGKLKALIMDPEIRQQLAGKAFEYAKQHLSNQRMFEDYNRKIIGSS